MELQLQLPTHIVKKKIISSSGPTTLTCKINGLNFMISSDSSLIVMRLLLAWLSANKGV